MNRAFRLLQLELQETLRQPLTWVVFVSLFVAMLVGAVTGAARMERERATLASLAAEREKAVQDAKDAAQRYATPAGLKIDYHRDPTDAFGYMNYFLVATAVKPPLVHGALAVGQSDLQPSHIRIDFNSIFPDAAYDLGSPQQLKLGTFDLAFVFIYLAPLGLIALTASRLTGEQDSGTLRLIAAQPIRPLTVAIAKYLAIAITAVLAVVGGAAIALCIHGQLTATPQLLLVGVMVSLWVLLWIAMSALVASFWRGVIGSVVVLVLIWGGSTVLMPALASLAVTLAHPAPSRIAYIDASRQVMDGFYDDETQVHAAWLARFPQFASAAANMVNSPEVKRFARDDYYRQSLLPQRAAFETQAHVVLTMSDRLRLLSPSMMLDNALQTVAGTNTHRHVAFVAAADVYSETLRRYFEPLALANAANPQRSCPDCPGRWNFTRYDDVPAFVAVADETFGLRQSALTCLYLAALVAAVGLIAARRLRGWPL